MGEEETKDETETTEEGSAEEEETSEEEAGEATETVEESGDPDEATDAAEEAAEETVETAEETEDEEADDLAPEAGEPVDIPDEEELELVSIINVASAEQADLIEGMLRSEAIPTSLEDSAHSFTEGMDAGALDGIDVFVPAPYARRARHILKVSGIMSDVQADDVHDYFTETVAPLIESDSADTAPLVEDLTDRSREFFELLVSDILKMGTSGVELAKRLLEEAIRTEEENPIVYELPKLLVDSRSVTAAGLAEELTESLGDADKVETRVNLARTLGRLDLDAARPLIGLLSDEAMPVRDEALESLYFISNGFDFDYDPEDEESERKEAIQRWETWLEGGARRRGD